MRTVRNEDSSRYELLDGDVAVGHIAYREEAGIVDMQHVGIDPSRQGEGLAAVLAAGALADVRERGVTIVPSCPYMLGYVRKHPEVVDLVAADRRTDLGL